MGNDSSKVDVGIQQYSTLLARHELFADGSFDFDNHGHTVRATITESEHGSYVTRSISVCSADTETDSGQNEPSLGSYDNHGYSTPSEAEPKFPETASTCMKDSGYVEQLDHTPPSKLKNGTLTPIMDMSLESFHPKETQAQTTSEIVLQNTKKPETSQPSKPTGIVTPVLVHEKREEPHDVVTKNATNEMNNENCNNNVFQSIPDKVDQIHADKPLAIPNDSRLKQTESVRPKEILMIDTDQFEMDTPPLTPLTSDISVPVTPEVSTPELIRRGSEGKSYEDFESEVQDIYSELDEIANRLNDLSSRDPGDWYYQTESYRKITDCISEQQEDMLSSQDITRAFSLLRKYRLNDSPQLSRQIRQWSSPPNIDSDTRCPPSSFSAYSLQNSAEQEELNGASISFLKHSPDV